MLDGVYGGTDADLPTRKGRSIRMPAERGGAGASSSWPQEFVVVPARHVARARTEAFIRGVYAEAFGAVIPAFPNLLAAAFDKAGAPLCAAGLRFADDGFFSEAYLDRPIEARLSAEGRRPVSRRRIFEVTTLASRSPMASLRFVNRIGDFGRTRDFEWLFFTATDRLQRLLRWMGHPLVVLGAADPRRIADPERWGSYYTYLPRVCGIGGDVGR